MLLNNAELALQTVNVEILYSRHLSDIISFVILLKNRDVKCFIREIKWTFRPAVD